LSPRRASVVFVFGFLGLATLPCGLVLTCLRPHPPLPRGLPGTPPISIGPWHVTFSVIFQRFLCCILGGYQGTSSPLHFFPRLSVSCPLFFFKSGGTAVRQILARLPPRPVSFGCLFPGHLPLGPSPHHSSGRSRPGSFCRSSDPPLVSILFYKLRRALSASLPFRVCFRCLFLCPSPLWSDVPPVSAWCRFRHRWVATVNPFSSLKVTWCKSLCRPITLHPPSPLSFPVNSSRTGPTFAPCGIRFGGRKSSFPVTFTLARSLSLLSPFSFLGSQPGTFGPRAVSFCVPALFPLTSQPACIRSPPIFFSCFHISLAALRLAPSLD